MSKIVQIGTGSINRRLMRSMILTTGISLLIDGGYSLRR